MYYTLGTVSVSVIFGWADVARTVQENVRVPRRARWKYLGGKRHDTGNLPSKDCGKNAHTQHKYNMGTVIEPRCMANTSSLCFSSPLPSVGETLK